MVAVAVFVWSSGRITRLTNQFGDDVLHKRWDKAYSYMSPAEIAELNMDRDQFRGFCEAYASYGWPDRDHLQIEEIEPFTPSDAQADSSWTKSGTRRYAVTFRRPTGSVLGRVCHGDSSYRPGQRLGNGGHHRWKRGRSLGQVGGRSVQLRDCHP